MIFVQFQLFKQTKNRRTDANGDKRPVDYMHIPIRDDYNESIAEYLEPSFQFIGSILLMFFLFEYPSRYVLIIRWA